MGVVLVPYDGSDASKKAIYKAEELLKEGDRFVVLHVIPQYTEFASLDPSLTRKKAQEMLDTIAGELKARNVNAETMVKVGNIADEILNIAVELGCRIIVVGSTGKNTEKIGRFMLGSVADKVARHATCPVLIVR
jgi:nucleotide-binding universal stress UspA family protein